MIKSYVFPGDIDEQIASIGAKPFIYMRTDEFSGINLESERMLLELIHCSAGRTIIYTGSGTGAMSAVVENYVSTRSKAFVVDGGSFDWEKSGRYPWLSQPNPSYHGVQFTKAAPNAPFVTYIRAILLRDEGACISPFAAFLLLQGTETLSLRLERHAENTKKVVEFLVKHPMVESQPAGSPGPRSVREVFPQRRRVHLHLPH